MADFPLALIPIGPRERIVEIHCGSGELSVEMARRAPEGLVAALDADADAVRRARARAGEAGLENVLFTPADATIPWREGFFSLAVSHGPPPDPGDVLRVLVPGGLFCVIGSHAADALLSQAGFRHIETVLFDGGMLTSGRKPSL